MKKVMFILVSIIVWYACSEDEAGIPEISGVTSSTFMDERDSSVYHCVTIDGQTWMAENLHYRLPWGTYSGCYSYGEKQLDSLSFTADVSQFFEVIRIALLVDKVITDVDGQMIPKLMNVRDKKMTPRAFVASYSTYPEVYGFMFNVIQKLEMESREPLVASCLKQAERENGGYKDRYGYLYTYEAAKAALPAGWDLPTDEDWKKLEKALGMNEAEVDKMEAWRGNQEGVLVKEGGLQGMGLNIRMGGGRLYGSIPYGSVFRDREASAYFWTSTPVALNDSSNVIVIRKLMYNRDQIFRGTSKTLKVAYSVRGIKR